MEEECRWIQCKESQANAMGGLLRAEPRGFRQEGSRHCPPGERMATASAAGAGIGQTLELSDERTGREGFRLG